MKNHSVNRMKFRGNHSIFSLLIILLSSFFSNSSFPQDISKTNHPEFHLVLWPKCLIAAQTSPSYALSESLFESAWQENRMLTYLGQSLSIVSSKSSSFTDSLEKYLQSIQYTTPECIEGDRGFVEKVINQQEIRYLPIMEPSLDGVSAPPPLRGEIVFFDSNSVWIGRLGVVHPLYGVGGLYQIEYWKKETGKDPDIVTFYSPQETLRHLLIGSIQAAAIPEGVLENFLKEHHREDSIDRFVRIRIKEESPYPLVFLRKDLYGNPLTRTLICETWLRNGFPHLFRPLPVTILQP